VPLFDITILSAKGSLYATRPTVMAYTARRADLLANAADLFDMVGKGAVKITVSRTYPLREAAAAHRDLEARKTAGSVVLIP
jgi:NADPH2:quinone reductase